MKKNKIDKIELLPELQNSQVDILQELIKVLNENKITYFLTGGSVLGSVHYKGFLPYDDDIDVAIPRKDYQRLIGLMKDNRNLFGENTMATHFSIDSDFDYPIIKVFNKLYKVTSLLDNEHKVSYPFIDVAPLDGSPNSKFKKRLFNLEFKILAKLYAYSTKKINANEKSEFIYNIQLKVSNLVSFFVRKEPLFFLKKLDALISQNDFSSSEFSGTLLGRYGVRELIPSADWGKGSINKFENVDVMLPEKVDCYIHDLYGGYTKYSQEDFLKERHILILGRNNA